MGKKVSSGRASNNNYESLKPREKSSLQKEAKIGRKANEAKISPSHLAMQKIREKSEKKRKK